MRIGVDIIEKERWLAIKNEARVRDFYLTASEQIDLQNRPYDWGYGASRLAAKEAVIKALPVAATYLDFTLVTDDKGGLQFVPQNQQLGKYVVAVSIAHSTKTVIGFAICT